MRTKIWISITMVFMLLASCNMPTGSQPTVAESPAAPGVDAMGTSVELTTVARMTELASPAAVVSLTDTPANPPAGAANPTACVPLVTATTAANVRSGPDTAYDVIGYLPLGGTANVAGRNDANTWWYINFAGGAGGYAWVAGSVVTASCLPTVVQVVAAPPLPTSQPVTSTFTPEPPEATEPPVAAGLPDLTANGMQYAPDPGRKNQPISIQVRVTNNSGVAAGGFTVVWLKNQDEVGCTWAVQGLGAGNSKALSCVTTYSNSPARSSTYSITLRVDSGNQVVESNEGNNEQYGQLKVDP